MREQSALDDKPVRVRLELRNDQSFKARLPTSGQTGDGAGDSKSSRPWSDNSRIYLAEFVDA